MASAKLPGKINGKNVLQHLTAQSSIESLALPEGIDRTILPEPAAGTGGKAER